MSAISLKRWCFELKLGPLGGDGIYLRISSAKRYGSFLDIKFGEWRKVWWFIYRKERG